MRRCKHPSCRNAHLEGVGWTLYTILIAAAVIVFLVVEYVQ